MSKDKKLGSLLTPSVHIPEVELRAVLAVVDHAHDAEDAALLLDMLGLIKPSDGLHQDHECPTEAAHRRVRARAAARRSGLDPEGSGVGA